MPSGPDPCMHTAEHILNQAMVRMFDCGRCFSAHINPKKSKCDYHFSRNITKQEKNALEKEVNRIISSDLAVIEDYYSLEQARNSFNLSRLPRDTASRKIRVIHIDGYDSCPCIGPHASSTAALGHFRITTHDQRDGVLRIRFKLESEMKKQDV